MGSIKIQRRNSYIEWKGVSRRTINERKERVRGEQGLQDFGLARTVIDSETLEAVSVASSQRRRFLRGRQQVGSITLSRLRRRWIRATSKRTTVYVDTYILYTNIYEYTKVYLRRFSHAQSVHGSLIIRNEIPTWLARHTVISKLSWSLLRFFLNFSNHSLRCRTSVTLRNGNIGVGPCAARL